MTVNSSLLPKCLIHYADQSANNILFPVGLGSHLSPTSFIPQLVGLLTTYQGRYCFNSFFHPSIQPFKRHLLSALANQWARGFILLFLILTLPWGNILAPVLQMTNWDLDKFINLLDQVCTMSKLVPILLLYRGQEKATDDSSQFFTFWANMFFHGLKREKVATSSRSVQLSWLNEYICSLVRCALLEKKPEVIQIFAIPLTYII